MQTTTDDGYITDDNSYCPDYINWKKEEKNCGLTLQKWLSDKEKEGRK